MSDHVDGPRSIGDPAADVTDLFAFTSPQNPARSVVAMCVFPSAGENATFSNVVDYSIALRRVTVAGVGTATKFQPGDEESVPARSAFVTWEGNHHEYDLCRLPAAARGAPGIDRNGRVPGGLRGLWWLRPTAAAAPARRQLGPGDLGPKQLAMRRIK